MAEHPARRPRRSHQTTLLVVAVTAAGFNLRTAIANLPPLFPDLQARLHLSSAGLSLLAATPVICFGAAAAFAAWLNRRFGEEVVLLAALIVLTAGLLLRGAAPGIMLFPGTVLAASAIAILNVLLSSMIKRRSPERAGVLIGTYLTALCVGAIIASLLSVPLYHSSGGSVRLALGLWAGPAALATLLWLPQLRYRAPRATRAVPSSGLTPAPARIKVYKYALAWQVMAFMGLQSLLYYAALSWLPTIFQERGTSAVTAGNLLALMAAGNLVAALTVPVLAHRAPDHRALVVPSMTAMGVGLAGSLWAPLGGVWLWVLVLGVGQGAFPDEAMGQLEAMGDEISFIQRVRAEQFENVDFTFFASDQESTRRSWKDARDASSAIIDLSSALENEPGATVRSLWIERERGQVAAGGR